MDDDQDDLWQPRQPKKNRMLCISDFVNDAQKQAYIDTVTVEAANAQKFAFERTREIWSKYKLVNECIALGAVSQLLIDAMNVNNTDVIVSESIDPVYCMVDRKKHQSIGAYRFGIYAKLLNALVSFFDCSEHDLEMTILLKRNFDSLQELWDVCSEVYERRQKPTQWQRLALYTHVSKMRPGSSVDTFGRSIIQFLSNALMPAASEWLTSLEQALKNAWNLNQHIRGPHAKPHFSHALLFSQLHKSIYGADFDVTWLRE